MEEWNSKERAMKCIEKDKCHFKSIMSRDVRDKVFWSQSEETISKYVWTKAKIFLSF
jgi:hypothetical protein